MKREEVVRIVTIHSAVWQSLECKMALAFPKQLDSAVKSFSASLLQQRCIEVASFDHVRQQHRMASLSSLQDLPWPLVGLGAEGLTGNAAAFYPNCCSAAIAKELREKSSSPKACPGYQAPQGC